MAFKQVINGQDRLLYRELLEQSGAEVDETAEGDVWRLRATKGDKRVEMHRDGWGLRTAAFEKMAGIWHSRPEVERKKLFAWLGAK